VNWVTDLSEQKGLFYGWKVVGALFVMLAFSSGIGFYGHSIILQALARESGFDVGLASSAVSLFFLVAGLTGLIIAPLIERIDVRIVIAMGTILASVSLAMIGRVTTTAELFGVYVLFGIGWSGSGLLPATTLIARWFQTNRAKALSIASTGLSVGGITVTPLMAFLVDEYSLYGASPMLGVIYLIGILPIALLVLRSSPTDVGLSPDGSSSVVAANGILLMDALRHPFFWSLSIAYIFVMAAQVGGIAHQYGVLTERVSAAQAAYGIAILPAASVVGRLVGGMILDRVSTSGFTIIMMMCQATSLFIIASSTDVYILFLGLALFGISVGNLLMLPPLIIAEVYGLVNYSQIYSWSNLITMMGVAAGPVLMGILVGESGAYLVPYLVAGALGLTAAIVFIVFKPPQPKV